MPMPWPTRLDAAGNAPACEYATPYSAVTATMAASAYRLSGRGTAAERSPSRVAAPARSRRPARAAPAAVLAISRD